MSVTERAIRWVLENVPIVMLTTALLVATFVSGIEPIAERYLAWLLLLTVGVQGVWAGVTHVVFPETGARYIGWQRSPFQTELGFADIAIGVVAIISFWQGLEFKSAVVAFLVIFYSGLAWGHIRDNISSGNREKGNFGALLVMTMGKAIIFPVLLWLAFQGQAASFA